MTKSLTIPQKIKPGDTIGIVCPSAGVNIKAKHRIDNAKSALEKLGYKVKLGRRIFVEDGSYVSGTVKERVDDLHRMFLDDDITMIMAAIGGNHSNQILRFLDYELIRKHPKVFTGYSDITVLHYALNTQANLATYYGPCAATQFGEYPEILPYTKDSMLNELARNETPRAIAPSSEWTEEFLNWFEKHDLSRARNLHKNPGYKILRHGASTSPALPACIMSVNRLAGTKYWIAPDNKILVLDTLVSEGELDYGLVDALLTDLFNIGVFDNLKGLIISRPAGFSQDEKKALADRILELTQHTEYPIIMDFDIGHTDPINTLRFNQTIAIDTQKQSVTILD